MTRKYDLILEEKVKKIIGTEYTEVNQNRIGYVPSYREKLNWMRTRAYTNGKINLQKVLTVVHDWF